MKIMSITVTAVLMASALTGVGATRSETGRLTASISKGNYVSDATTVGVEKRDVVINRLFDAPVARVWKAWTNPEYVMLWWGPTGFTSPSCKIDLREGGRFLFHMRAPKEFQGGQDFYLAGVYKKIVPLTLIEFSSQSLADKDGNRIDPTTMGMPADFPKEIPSALAFKRVGDKTELTVSEYGWTAGQMRDMSEAGMNECLDKLAKILASHE